MFALAGGHAAQSRLSFIGFANVKEKPGGKLAVVVKTNGPETGDWVHHPF